MSQSELENRLKQRYPSSLFVSVFLGSDKEFFGLLVDLSSTGFKLSTGAELLTKQEYGLAIRNPFSGRNEDFNYFSASAIWCQEGQDGLYEIGFQFASFEEETEGLFKRLLTDFESTARKD